MISFEMNPIEKIQTKEDIQWMILYHQRKAIKLILELKELIKSKEFRVGREC